MLSNSDENVHLYHAFAFPEHLTAHHPTTRTGACNGGTHVRTEVGEDNFVTLPAGRKGWKRY